MFTTSKYILMFDLQLFADGSGAGAGTGVSGSAAGNDGDSGDLSDVQYGISFDTPADNETAATPATNEDTAEDFDSLIKGKFKEAYDSRVQDIVQNRVRNMNETNRILQSTADKYGKALPLIEAMAQRYNVADSNDIDAILAAFDEDSQLLEAEAEERGIPTDQLKRIKKMERENAVLKNKQLQADRERSAAQTVELWNAQAEEARKLYPELDLMTELQNQKFANKLRNGESVKEAYEAVHHDDIVQAAIAHAVREAEQKVARSVAAGAKRPSEGGNGSGVAAIHKTDVSSLTSNDMKEIYKRVMSGERISFG